MVISRREKLNAEYWQSPKQLKAAGIKPRSHNQHSDLPHRLRGCARLRRTHHLLSLGGSEAGEGEGGGESACCLLLAKERGTLGGFCYLSCFQIIHVYFPCPGFLSQRFGSVWPLVKEPSMPERPGCLLKLL